MRPREQGMYLRVYDAQSPVDEKNPAYRAWKETGHHIDVPLSICVNADTSGELAQIIDDVKSHYSGKELKHVLREFGKSEERIPPEIRPHIEPVMAYVREVAARLYIPKRIRKAMGIREEERASLKIPLAEMLLRAATDGWISKNDIAPTDSPPPTYISRPEQTSSPVSSDKQVPRWSTTAPVVRAEPDGRNLASKPLSNTPDKIQRGNKYERALLEALSLGVIPQERIVGELKALIQESIVEGEDPTAYSLHFMEVKRDQPEQTTHFGKRSKIQSDFLFRIYKRTFIPQADSGHWAFADTEEDGIPKPVAEFSTRVMGGDEPKPSFKKALQSLGMEAHVEAVFALAKSLKEEAERVNYGLPRQVQFPMRYIT